MTKYSQNFRADFNDSKNKNSVKFGRSFLFLFIIALFISSLVVYLSEVNTIAVKGFQIRELEKQARELKEENEKLSFKAVELKSMGELKARIDNLKMVPVGEITYYDVAGQVVVRK